MLGKRIINTATGVACTTDTVQILDGVPFQSIATYELDGDAESSVKTGYIGNAAIFNGSSSSIATPITTNYSNLSISCWVKFNALPTGNADATLVSKGFYVSGSNTQYLHLRYEDFTDQFTFAIRQNSTYNQQAVSGVTATTGVWYHVVGTLDSSGNAQIYVNGSAGTGITSAPTMTNSDDFEIGSFATTVSLLNGSIDQVRIFNKALSSSEVTTLYGETSASSTKSTTDIFADSSGLALYEFESNANDTGGTYNGTATNVVYNEYDGTASNVTYSTGKFGQAGVFNGSSSYINYDNFTFPANDFTFSAWANTNNVASQYNMITTIAKSGSGFMYLTFEYNKLFYYDGGSTVSLASSVGSISNNTWYHCLITKSSTDGIKLYLNGNLVGSNAATTSNPTNGTGQNRIGHYYTPTSIGHFNGSIDQVRIYDKAISASDVTTLYNETVATASTNITLEVPSLVAYYKMNDATDETGSYDGTPTNVNFNVAGKFGNAGDFNGTSSKINTGYIQTGQVYSASFWGKGFSAGASVLRDTPAAGGANTFMDISTGANGQVIIGGNVALVPSYTPSTDWTHYAVVLDGTNATIYENGSQIATKTYTAKTGNNGTPVHMMSNGAYFAGFSAGYLDQVRIFSRAITANEVTTLYNEVYCQPTIVPTDYFNTVLYTGNDTDTGYTRDITGVGFKPDIVWIKDRDNGGFEHAIFDSVRGSGTSKVLSSNTTNQEGWTVAAPMSAFIDDGFSVQPRSPYNVNNLVNKNGEDFVSWNWKAANTTTTIAAGTVGNTIASDVRANTDAGFSIVKYTGNGIAGATIGHGIDTPELIIVKELGNSNNWQVYSSPTGATNFLYLNSTLAATPATNRWNDTTPTSTVFTVGDSLGVNRSSGNFIAYAFHSVDGMSKIGSYVGTGASGNSIVTGFRPAFVMIKRTSASGSSWAIFDNKRGVGEPSKVLYANLSDSEYSDNLNDIEFSSNGFTLLDNNEHTNYSSNTYIFMAFAEENVQPQPELANSFNTVTYTGTGTTGGNTLPVTGFGFQPDLVWIKNRDVAVNHYLYDSVRGTGAAKALHSNATSSESTASVYAVNGGVSSFLSDGFTAYRGTDNTYQGTNMNGQDYVAWAWKASNESTINQDGSITSVVSANPAAGFSIVKYTGTGSNASFGHGLSSLPELVIVKRTNALEDWFVLYDTANTPPNYMKLNTTAAGGTSSGVFPSPATSTVVNVGNGTATNLSGSTYIAYCFHSVDGYQKVGSYVGNATTNVVTTGFQPKFLLVKASSHASSWYVIDSERTDDKFLSPNSSNAEYTDANKINFTSTGFTLTSTSYNNSGYTWIYLAIA